MTIHLAAALITAAMLGLCFSPTRWLAIAAISVLTFSKPWIAILVAVGITTWLYLFKFYK